MEKLSVTIITFNEEKNIEPCLESLKWADEIVVLDSFSSDRTVEICKRYTERVFQEPWSGYGKQKNLCAARASHRWILNIDADERVTPSGAEEIQRVLSREPEQSLFFFPRKNFFGDRWVRYGGWYPDRIGRLYDKTRSAFTETRVHETLCPGGDMGVLDEPLLHYSFAGMADYIERQNRYSSLFAEEWGREGRKAGWTDLVFRPPWTFFKAYVLRQGFREGYLGLFLGLSMAFYTFLKYAKTRAE